MLLAVPLKQLYCIDAIVRIPCGGAVYHSVCTSSNAAARLRKDGDAEAVSCFPRDGNSTSQEPPAQQQTRAAVRRRGQACCCVSQSAEITNGITACAVIRWRRTADPARHEPSEKWSTGRAGSTTAPNQSGTWQSIRLNPRPACRRRAPCRTKSISGYGGLGIQS